MHLFKIFMKISLTKISTIIMYMVITFVMSVVGITSTVENNSIYVNTRLKVCIVNEDNSPESYALEEYIATMHDIENIETNKDTLIDSLYYQRVNYVFTIKEGYAEKLERSETDGLFSNCTVPGVYTTELMDMQLDNYVKTVLGYKASGCSLDEAVEKAASALEYETDIKMNTLESSSNVTYFNFLAYVFISIMIMAFSPVFITINSKEIRNRTFCSPIPVLQQTFQSMLGLTVCSMAVVAIFFIAYGFMCSFTFDRSYWLAFLNGVAFMLVAAGLSLLVSMLVKSPNAVTAVANILGIGMSFLCGVFVPQEFLGDEVLMIARFLPAYWYVKANDMLTNTAVFSINEYLSYIIIELLFAAVIFILAMVISKVRVKEKS